MRAPTFDLGLSPEDLRALGEARRARLPVDREAALKFMADVSPLVHAAVSRRPVLVGEPFRLPGHKEEPREP